VFSITNRAPDTGQVITPSASGFIRTLWVGQVGVGMAVGSASGSMGGVASSRLNSQR
jgi:hypothetical protein